MNRIILKQCELKQVCRVVEYSTISNSIYYDKDLNIYILKFKLLDKNTINESLECVEILKCENYSPIDVVVIFNSQQYKNDNWLDIKLVVDC